MNPPGEGVWSALEYQTTKKPHQMIAKNIVKIAFGWNQRTSSSTSDGGVAMRER
jgi:hypothetical protein